jgi:lactoylglutathione lyase
MSWGTFIDSCQSDPEVSMSRVQLALNVDDIDEAIGFYTKLFATEPAKIRPGYANFAIAEPPLKLVLIENPGHGGSLNHLGVEVERPEDVAAATARLADDGLATATEDQVTCCYALQDKVWVDDPNGAPWEIYTVLADADAPAGTLRHVDPTDGATCGPGACGTPAGTIPVASDNGACCAG